MDSIHSNLKPCVIEVEVDASQADGDQVDLHQAFLEVNVLHKTSLGVRRYRRRHVAAQLRLDLAAQDIHLRKSGIR